MFVFLRTIFNENRVCHPRFSIKIERVIFFRQGHSEEKLSYWRTYTGVEVDVIVGMDFFRRLWTDGI